GLTRSGAILGVPHYMSPEQCLGRKGDSRSDVYTLGVILYEMLTATRPFDGQSPAAVVVAHVNQTPEPLRNLNVSVPPDLEAAVLHALQKDPARRPQTPGEFAQELSGIPVSKAAYTRSDSSMPSYPSSVPMASIPTPTMGSAPVFASREPE